MILGMSIPAVALGGGEYLLKEKFLDRVIGETFKVTDEVYNLSGDKITKDEFCEQSKATLLSRIMELAIEDDKFENIDSSIIDAGVTRMILNIDMLSMRFFPTGSTPK